MAQSKQKSKNKSKLDNLMHLQEDSEHELFYYANNRIELMKEVLKLIKPKKIKSIAPDFMKNLDMEEINSMLLEELLGISNKRLKCILNGENKDTSSSESEEERPIDVISLDDISDSEDDFGSDGVNPSRSDGKGKKHRSKRVPRPIKKEKQSIPTSESMTNESENEKLMSVLEILELQARARAIRSQLALENISKKQSDQVHVKEEDSDESDAIVVDSPKNEEIVITSSDSENEGEHLKRSQEAEVCEVVTVAENVDSQQMVTSIEQSQSTTNLSKRQVNDKQEANGEKVMKDNEENTVGPTVETYKYSKDNSQRERNDSENDDVINLDIDEIEND